jgi:P27 family predicted phage terminase small subunit
MRGQKQKSSLKILKNNAAKDPSLKNPDTLKREPLPESPPRTMSKEGKKFWKEIVSKINQAENTFLSVDSSFLQRYCELKGEYQKWFAHVQEFGVRIEEYIGDQVKVKESPEFRAFKNMTPIINQMETQLGLNPLGRHRLGIEVSQDKEEDLLSNFLNRKSKKQA